MIEGQIVGFCKCGCGNPIRYKKFYKYQGISKYIHTHHPSWNKGLTKETNESVKRISEKKKGNKFSLGHYRVECIFRFCKMCGEQLSRQYSIKKKNFCSRKCYWESLIGKIPWNKGISFRPMEQHHNWKGGKSFEPYGIEFNKNLKRLIRKRDCFTCQKCYISELELGKALDIHHIDYNKKNNDSNNLISLCKGCHIKTNYNREMWEKWFKEKFSPISNSNTFNITKVLLKS